MENGSQGTPRPDRSTPKPTRSSRRVQVAASATALLGILAIAPIGRTGFYLPAAVSGLMLLVLAVLIYLRSFVALVLATLAQLSVAAYAVLTSPAAGLIFLPFVLACIQALRPMWDQRRERRKPAAPKPGPAAVSITYASFWIRALAALIDCISFTVSWWVAVILLTVAFAVAGVFSMSHPSPAMYDALVGPGYLLGLVLNVVYFVGFWTLQGRTPGMIVTGLRVATDRQQKLSLASGLLRYIVFIPSALLAVGLLWPIWDRQKQGWHDKAARSYVLRIQALRSSLPGPAIASGSPAAS